MEAAFLLDAETHWTEADLAAHRLATRLVCRLYRWLVERVELSNVQTGRGRMNSYTMTFAANCPTNGVRTNFTWRIDSKTLIRVEEMVAIVESVESSEPAFHEEIADRLAERFDGEHTLTAYHHGVLIETKRTGAPSLPPG